MKLTLFGAPRLARKGHSVSVGRRKGLALLIYLAVTGRNHGRDTLATLMWPEASQRSARGNLRRTLSDLNRDIGPGLLAFTGDIVGLADAARFSCDVAQFRASLSIAAAHDHQAGESCPDCLTSLQAAVELYQADFMAGFTLSDAHEFDDWQYFEAEDLRRSLATALEQLIRECRDHDAAITYARRWLALDPLHEPAQQTLMRVYHRAGQTAAALRQYDLCVALMDEELGQPPMEETTALYASIKAARLKPPQSIALPVESIADEPAAPKPTAPRHHLPAQLTTFVGREDELVEIGARLRSPDCRLLTLVGPGGIGKSRLSLAVADAVKGDFADGVHFVRLAPLQNKDGIIPTVIESLGVRFSGQDDPHTQLVNYLADKELLLVMDNFEHLLAGARTVSDILRAAPHVNVLASSRERLNLRGETVYTVGGMPFPARMVTPPSARQIARFSSVRLLLQQARLHRSARVPDDALLNDAARICRLVQGMPLAIILAASWLDMLSMAEIGDEIAHSLDFLETEMRDVPDRQRSMRAVFNTSWQQLTAGEQTTFIKLSVFRGGFTRAAAQSVTGASLHALRGLVNKSFVFFGQADRFEVHELLRQYGAEALVAAGEEASTRQRHSETYLDFVQACEADLHGRAQTIGIRRLEADFDNIRAAWDWALVHKNETAVAAAAEALHLYFDMQGLYQIGTEFFTNGALSLRPVDAAFPSRAWGKVLARLRFMQSVTDETPADWKSELATCIDLAQQWGDEAEVALCEAISAVYYQSTSQDLPMTQALLESALQRYRTLGDVFYQGRVYGWLAICRYLMGDFVNHERYIRESLDHARTAGDIVSHAVALVNLAEIALVFGRYGEAEASCVEVLELDCRLTQPYGHGVISMVNLLAGKLDAAQRGLEQARSLYKMSNSVQIFTAITCVSSVRAALLEQNEASVREANSCLAVQVIDPIHTVVANWGLAISRCNQQDFAAARTYLSVAFAQARVFRSPALQTWLLPVAAVIAANADRTDLSREMMAVAGNHPLSPTGWHAKWRLFASLQKETANAVSSPVHVRDAMLDWTVALDLVISEWMEMDW